MFTMEALAQSVCQQLLSQLKLSNLNYVVTETPYSAQINIRKRFLKELSEANPAFFSSDMNLKKLTEENIALKAEIECVKTARNVEKDKVKALEGKIDGIKAEALKAHEKAKDESFTLKSVIRKLNTELDHHKSDLNQTSKNLKLKEKEVKKYEVKLENLEATVKDVRHENKILKADTKRLEKSLKLANTILPNDRGCNATQGSVSGQHKLEKQKNVNDFNQNILLVNPNSAASIPPPPASSSSPPVTPARAPATSSSPLATPACIPPSSPPWSPSPPRTLPPSPHTPPGIPLTMSSSSYKEPLTNSVPTSSLISESQSNSFIPVSKTNPTAHTNKFSRNFLFSPPNTEFPICNHSTQCIIREPLPPPFPSITFLHNEKSEYHKHMMQWSKKEFAGCVKCFSIENENYGCRDCRWLKFWYARHGETHGFPDMATWIYKKYL